MNFIWDKTKTGVVAVAGAGYGVIVGGFKEIKDQYLYDHTLLGFGGEYQKKLAENIQKNCGKL